VRKLGRRIKKYQPPFLEAYHSQTIEKTTKQLVEHCILKPTISKPMPFKPKGSL
jgi:hypothetical protein